MPGLKQGEKQKLALSRETMDGLKITGMVWYGMVWYVSYIA